MGTTKGYTVMIGGNAGLKPRLADKLIGEPYFRRGNGGS